MLSLAGSAAVAAVLGVGSASGAETYDRHMLLDATGSSDPCSYVVEASGGLDVVPTPGNDVSARSDTHVEGTVTRGRVAIRYGGSISTIDLDAPATVRLGDAAADRFTDLGREIVITSPTEIDYRFRTTGGIERVEDGSRTAAEANDDTIVSNDDGTVTVDGSTGNGYGDSYRIYGDVTAFTPLEGDHTIVVDGEEVSAYELTGQDPPQSTRLVITSPTEIDYEFTATDGVERVEDGSRLAAETNNDAIAENDDGTYRVTGHTGNEYGDSYEVQGEVPSFDPMEGDFTITYDGEEVSTYELTGQEPPDREPPDQEPPENDGPVIGGGEGYGRTVPESAADVVVSTRAQLDRALSSASDGDVVYVGGDADIYAGTSEFTIPRGVTLASDRGIDGSDGGRIYTDRSPWPMLQTESDVRVTGLRIEGPRSAWYARGALEEGLVADGSDVEVDNVEAYGWGWAAVRCHETAHVHHCEIHTNTESGSGYGVATTTAENVLIEYNHFHDNRHSVESTGGSWTARYNLVTGSAISHVFDQHDPGGETIEIYNNTVEVVDHDREEANVPAVAIRGVPSDVATIHDNWFHNPERPRETPDGWTHEAIIQVHTSSWENVEFEDNHYGSSEPSSDVGHPR